MNSAHDKPLPVLLDLSHDEQPAEIFSVATSPSLSMSSGFHRLVKLYAIG